MRLTHPPRDQLRILRPKINNEDSVELAQEPKLTGDDADGWPAARGPDGSLSEDEGMRAGGP